MNEQCKRVIDLIIQKSPLHKKKLEKSLARQDAAFYDDMEKFLTDYTAYLANNNLTLDYALDAYLQMCKEVLVAQVKFNRTGAYPVRQEDYQNIYQDEKTMKSYMTGLALSQFLWNTHYTIYKFFESCIKHNKNSIRSYLEIGPGHGLYLKKAIEIIPELTDVAIVDISKTSMDIVGSLMNFFYPEKSELKYYQTDILDFNYPEHGFDFITMGEVLEHVREPQVVLKKLGELLVPQGKIFLSTCVNCPAIDHVYHFKNVDEIRDMLRGSGFRIARECILPTEDLPCSELIEKKITINYCTIIYKNGIKL